MPSGSFKQTRDNSYTRAYKDLITTLPSYFEDFSNWLVSRNKSTGTILSYIRGGRDFLQYIHDIIPACAGLSLKDMPVWALDKLTASDLDSYSTYLRSARMLTKTSVHARLVAISALYKYLNVSGTVKCNPFNAYERPVPGNVLMRSGLDANARSALLNGILANNLALAETDSGTAILPITHKAKVKREPQVLRNHALCSLLCDGFDLAEALALDVKDVDFNRATITISDNIQHSRIINLDNDTMESLTAYVNGLPLPEELLDKYKYTGHPAFEWCLQYSRREHFQDLLAAKYPNEEDSFYSDMARLRMAVLRQGRKNLKPKPGEQALFISSRGTRLTSRMAQYLVKEMALTYIPDEPGVEEICPSLLKTRRKSPESK